MHWCVVLDKVEKVEELLEEGIDVNDSENKFKHTPLHWAATHGRLILIELLVRKGADLDRGDVDGYTPLISAVQKGNVLAIHLLIKRGANKDVCDNMGHHPLHWAAYQNYVHLVRYFLLEGVHVNITDHQKRTPLHWAAWKASYRALFALLKGGADRDLIDSEGFTPYSLAKSNSQLLSAGVLINYSPETSLKGTTGLVVLMAPVILEVLTFLLFWALPFWTALFISALFWVSTIPLDKYWAPYAVRDTPVIFAHVVSVFVNITFCSSFVYPRHFQADYMLLEFSWYVIVILAHYFIYATSCYDPPFVQLPPIVNISELLSLKNFF